MLSSSVHIPDKVLNAIAILCTHYHVFCTLLCSCKLAPLIVDHLQTSSINWVFVYRPLAQWAISTCQLCRALRRPINSTAWAWSLPRIFSISLVVPSLCGLLLLINAQLILHRNCDIGFLSARAGITFHFIFASSASMQNFLLWNLVLEYYA